MDRYTNVFVVKGKEYSLEEHGDYRTEAEATANIEKDLKHLKETFPILWHDDILEIKFWRTRMRMGLNDLLGSEMERKKIFEYGCKKFLEEK